jgi:glyoxylase-like metal-dependent hydrolase (beta-lactamase superfamily II)
VLLDGDDGATLIDTGHSVHAAQTVAQLRQRLGGKELRHVVNTSLHADPCGDHAAAQRGTGAGAGHRPARCAKTASAWSSPNGTVMAHATAWGRYPTRSTRRRCAA